MSSATKSPIKLLYVTCKDTDQARSIGNKLITERLAACVNIIPGMESIYPWDGKIETSAETVMIVKTTESQASKCAARITEIHDYEVPCVLEISITGGHDKYLNWLRDQIP